MASGGGHDKFRIKIDKDSFTVEQPAMTGTELRGLPSPKIGPERDLWLTIPGPEDDDRIEDAESVDLKDGMHFYTAPSTINPGGNAQFC